MELGCRVMNLHTRTEYNIIESEDYILHAYVEILQTYKIVMII